MGESEGSDDGGRRGENETGRWGGNRLVVGLRLCAGAMVRPWQCVFRKNTQDNRFVVGTGPSTSRLNTFLCCAAATLRNMTAADAPSPLSVLDMCTLFSGDPP